MRDRLVGRTAELRRLRRATGRGAIHGAILAGPAGVGKTRLAREWHAATSKHRRAVSVTGATATASVPFGAFAPLLPGKFPADASPLEVLQAARQALLEESTNGRELAVLVDDAHLLDEASAALVHQLVDGGDAFVVMTLRDGEQVPEAIVAAGKDERVEWIELGPLTRDGVRALGEQLLGGRLESSTIEQVWGRAGGNPLFVTELLRGGLEAGVLVGDDGLWRATGPLTVSTRLQQVLAARIRNLPDDQRRAFEVVACAERFELQLVEGLLEDPAVLEKLEQRGFVTLMQDRRRTSVDVSHPLYAEVVRSETAALTTRHVASGLARSLVKPGLRRRDDLLRWASWQLDSGEPASADRLLEAARRAKAALDPVLAERCADAAVTAGGGFDAQLLRADAVAAQGRIDQAHEQFRRLTRSVEDDASHAQVTLAHASSLLFHAGDPQVLEILEAALEVVDDPGWRDELEAILVFAAAYLGELPRAIEEGERLIDRLEQGTPAVVRTAVIYTYVQALLGHYYSGSPVIDRGLQAAEHAREAFPIGEHLLQVNRVFGLETSGRIHEAEQFARAGYQQAIAADTLDVRGLWATNLGFALCFRGDLAGFVSHLDEALVALRQRDPVGMLLLALSIGALAHAMCGQPGRARQLLAEYDAHSEGRTPAFGTNWRYRVDAWLHANGLGEDAARLALHAGQIAHDEHQIAYGSLALHDAVRFGHPELVLDLLDDFAATAEGDLIPAFAEHAELLDSQDVVGLEELSHRFETMGADLYAAEAAAQASHLQAQAGNHLDARRSRSRSLALAGTATCCPTLWRWISRPGELTNRELEIARLAATGRSDRAIAEQLAISPRTVGNHLTSVYAKLNIAGRNELADLLRLA